MTELSARLAALEHMLGACAPAAVALSGGVDSMTLAVIAGRRLGSDVAMYHAVSAAVPPAATARVRAYAERCGWQLILLDAGEFSDPNYLANPANRCFFCKANLYGTLAAQSDAQLLSGTNLDDLGDWRPGLEAAKRHAVRHPFVEAGIAKATVRALAASLGLHDLAELPAAPCLSSRVETGLAIQPGQLRLIDQAEQLVRASLKPETVRCRIRADGVVIELDDSALARLSDADDQLTAQLAALFAHEAGGPPRFGPYRRGSAFLRDQPHG